MEQEQVQGGDPLKDAITKLRSAKEPAQAADPLSDALNRMRSGKSTDKVDRTAPPFTQAPSAPMVSPSTSVAGSLPAGSGAGQPKAIQPVNQPRQQVNEPPPFLKAPPAPAASPSAIIKDKSGREFMDYTDSLSDDPLVREFVSLTKGKKYKLGAKGTGNISSLGSTTDQEVDCSGAMCAVVNKFRDKAYDPLYTSAATIASKSKPLKPEEASRGDYVFMRTGGKGVDHIGMLITDTAGRKYIAESSSSFNGPSITLLQDRIDSLKKSSPNLIVEYGRDDSNISREPVSSGQRSAGGPPAGPGAGQPLAQSTGLGGPVGGTRFALPTEQEEMAIDVERGVTKSAKPIGDKFTASDISDAVIGQQRSEEMYAERIKAGFGIEPRKGESARDTYREMTSYYDDQVASLDARGVEALKANTEKGIQGLRGMASELKQEMDGLEQAAREFEQQISALPPEQAKAALDAFNTNAQEQARLLDGRRKEIEDLEYALVRDLQMAALRDHDIKKETGSGWGVAALVGPKGVGKMTSGLTSFIIDGMTALMPAEFVGPEVASGEKTRDQAAKEIKRLMLDDIRKGGSELTRKALGLETTDEYYQDAASNGPFMAKAMIGLGESLPAMASPYMTGIFFQTADAIGEELEGEGFDDILEIEKVGLKAAFALPALALERLGFRNLVKNSAATKTILARAIGKIPMNATPGQIQRIIDGETRSYVTNFAARMGGAALSEGETGGAQAALDITTREIYNGLKGRDILKTPETLVDAAYQIAEGSALEMAGAGALGAPVALRAAMQTGSVTRNITDRQYSLLEGLLTDENYAGTIASYHDELVKSGKMTSEQKVKIEEDLRVAQEIASQIPEDLPTEKRREAFDLLLEKQRLSGKDKNLVKGRIIDIDDELMNLAGAKPAAKEGDVKTEAPTPPQAPVPVSPEVRDEILRARQELGVDFDPLEDLPESVVITFGRVEDNIPVSAVDIEAASSWMYKKYKDVMSMRNDPNRLLTLDQIDSYAAQLGADIELLENHKQKLRDESEGVGSAQAANTKGATAPVSGTQATETKPQGRVAPTATQDRDSTSPRISWGANVVLGRDRNGGLITQWEESDASKNPSTGKYKSENVEVEIEQYKDGYSVIVAPSIGDGKFLANKGASKDGFATAQEAEDHALRMIESIESRKKPQAAQPVLEEGQVTPTAKGPVSPVDGEMTVKSFAESIASGNRLDTPEAVQFYENNKKEIEAELQRMAGPQKQAPQQAPVDPNDDAEVTLDEEVADDPDALLEEAMGTPLTDEEIDAEMADITKSVSGTDTEVIDLDQDGYAKVAKDASGDASNSMSEGFFIGKDRDGKRRIYINRDMFRRGLMAHEGTHAIIFAALSKDPKAKKIISNSAKQALGASPGAKKVLLKFLENYGGAKTKADGSVDVDATVADPELGEEVMSEFVAALYNGTIKLDNATRQFIRDLYNRIMAALGVSTKVEFKEDGDFIAAAKQIASAMRAGRKIKTGGSGKGGRAGTGPRYSKSDADSVFSDKRISKSPVAFDNILKEASDGSFDNQVDFKDRIQELLIEHVPALKEKYGRRFDPSVNDKTTKQYLIDSLTPEAASAIIDNSDALGWYDAKTKGAVEVVAAIHPELLTDNEAASAFILALAITSNGNKVGKNFEYAMQQYERYKSGNGFDSEGLFGIQQIAIQEHFRIVNDIIEQGVTMGQLAEWLMTTHRAGDLSVRVDGKKVGLASSESPDNMVHGAVIFGSKIGDGFFMNMWGRFDQLTMDRWFMRTIGRFTGTLQSRDPKKKAAGKKRLDSAMRAVLSDSKARAALRAIADTVGDDKDSRATRRNGEKIQSGLSDLISLAVNIEKASMHGPTRAMLKKNPLLDELRKAGNSLSKSRVQAKEAPSGPTERNFLRDVIKGVRDKLKNDMGIDISIADLQAVLWYPEKRLYDSFKEDQDSDSAKKEQQAGLVDYESAAKKLANDRGYTDEQIAESRRVGQQLRDSGMDIWTKSGAGKSVSGSDSQYHKAVLDAARESKERSKKLRAEKASSEADTDSGSGISSDPKFSKKTPAAVRAGAEKVRAMTKEDRDNYDPSEDGNYYGYNLYDAERLVPKPTEKPKRVTDSNSLNLSSEWHSVINVDGTVYGLTKYEDPDAADDSEDSAGFPKEYVWAYARMDDPSSVKETTTRDVAELVNDIKGSVGPKFSKKTPATQGDFKKGRIKDLLDKKDWVIMTAENPSAKKMSDAQNASRMKLLMADLDAMGAEYTPVDGKYGNEEKSLAITGVTEKQAIKLGKKYGQESVLTNKGLVYQDGSYNPATGASELDTKPDDFYSVVNGQVFQIDIDFGEKVQPPKFSMGERRLKDKVEQTSGDVKFFQSGGDYFFSTADGFFKGIPEAGGKRISRQDYDSALSKERIKQLERGEVVRDMGNRSDSVVASDSDKTARSWMDKMVASDNAVMMKSTETASIQTLQGVAKEFGLSVDPNKAIKPALMSAVRREINRRKVSGEADKPKFSKATPGKNRVPQEHRDNLTDDGKGNYVFFHKGPKSLKGGKINPSYFGSGKSKDNRSNPVMNYYTKPDQGERMISGDVTYAVPVPKWKVYPLMSDPLDLYDKAEANFRKKFGKDQAFDAVRQADFIGPLAEKAGFDMMIAGWSVHPLRAESGKALKPDAKLTKKYEDEGVVDLTAPGAYERMMAKARGDVKFSSASPENIAKALIAKGYNTKAKAREYMVSKGADRMVDQVMAEFDKLRDASNARKAAPPKQAPQKPVGDGVKKTFAGQRVYEGSFRDEVREEVRKLGLFREVESRAEAREKAKKLIESVGIDAAVDAVRNKDMEGGAAAFVWDEALRQLDNEILESTDPTTHQELVAKQAEMVQEIGDMQLAAGRFNSAWGDILKNSDLGYYSEKKAKEWEDKFGERPSKEIMDGWRKRDEEMAEIKKKIDAAEKRAEEAQAKEAIQSIAESVIRDNNRKKSGKYSSQAKRMADQFRTLKTKPIVILDADGNPINITKLGSALPFDWNELIEVGAKAIEKTGQVADAVTAMAEKLNKQKWFSSLDDRNKMAVMSQLEDAVKGASEGFGNERIKVPVAMIRNAVAAGIRDIDMLVNVIKEQIKDQYPDASDREIRDAITGYGKVVNMSKDEISVAIRRMKDIGRVASALEDIEKKIRPMRSGLQRDKLDAEQRALHNKLRDAMRDLPVDQAENDRVLKTALEAAKTRARNRIEDLQREIDTKERAERKQSGIVPDSELAALIKERDMLKEEHDRVFGPRVVTEEMRVKSALDSIRRSIDEYERRIADNELDPKKPTPVRETPELKIARQNLSKLRDDYKKLQDEAGVVDRRRTEAAKKATKKRIAELERRIADQDFSKKPVRKTIADDELTTLRAEKERIKEQYDADFYKEMMRNRTKGQRVGDFAWEAWGVLRVVQSTLDLSFIGLQGGAMTISNMWRRPDVVASAFKNMFSAMGSEKRSEEWLRKIKAQPWYDQAKEAKLAITQPHAELTGREELFMSDWAQIFWSVAGLPLMLKSRAAHDRWMKINPFRALERGASAYLDTLRVERYLEGVKMLEARKADINGKEVTTQDYKDVADVVNTLTGRASLGALEGFSKGLTRMFYSPRMWASAIKTGTPYGLYHFGKMTPTARKMALMDMGRFFGTTMGVVTLSAIALAGDDDDETYVETDPRSSDFGKIRLGDIRIDPWGGRVQQAVAMTRMTIGGISLFMDKPIDAYKRGDKTMPLGKGFGTPTMFDVGLTMAMNKLSPSASFLVEAARTTIGKDGKRYSKYDKDPYVFKDEFNERLMPLYVGTVGDLMQEDPGALEGFLAFYGLFGGGVSVYGQKPKAKARPTSTTQRPARVPRRPE